MKEDQAGTHSGGLPLLLSLPESLFHRGVPALAVRGLGLESLELVRLLPIPDADHAQADLPVIRDRDDLDLERVADLETLCEIGAWFLSITLSTMP